MTRFSLIAAFAVSSCLIASNVFAQSDVNSLTVNQWVQPQEQGVLKGRLVVPAKSGASKVIANGSVSIVGTNGTKLAASTNENGEFAISNVAPGIYALTAQGESAFAAFAMHVLDSNVQTDTKFASEVEVCAASIRHDAVKQAISRYLPRTTQAHSTMQNVQWNAIAQRAGGEGSSLIVQVDGGMKGQVYAAGAKGSDFERLVANEHFHLARWCRSRSHDH